MNARRKRFDRASFHAKVGGLDANALGKILWNLYWRGPATLRGQDAWEMFCDAYLAALDGFAPRARTGGRRRGGRRSEAWSDDEWRRSHAQQRRAKNLAEWHGLLLDRLDVHDSERRLDRIASHPALAGPAADFMKARIRYLRGDKEEAQSLIEGCLEQQPGHREFIAFARKISAKLPRRSAEILREGDS